MKIQANWKPSEASPIYWLTLWGNTHKDIVELVAPMLPTRTRDGVAAMCGEIRRQLSIIKGFEVGQKPSKNIPDLVRKASQIEPIRDIASLKPANLSDVKFIPSRIKPHNPPVNKRPTQFTQVDSNPSKDLSYVDNIVTVKNTPKQRKQLSDIVEASKLPHIPNFAGKAISSLHESDIDQRVFGTDTEQLNFKLNNLDSLDKNKEQLKSRIMGFKGTGEQDLEGALAYLDEGRGRVEYSLEGVLKAAKAAGATKVCYKDYVIKFS